MIVIVFSKPVRTLAPAHEASERALVAPMMNEPELTIAKTVKFQFLKNVESTSGIDALRAERFRHT